MKIPVFEPEITAEDRAAVLHALERGEISGSGGKCLEDFEQKFAEYCGCAYGVATTSGTTALHLASHAAGFGPGDEVLVSTCTNIGTILGAHHLGATTVAVDSEAKTWNLDLDHLESLITPQTKGIIPVHFLGHPVDMDRLMAIADRRGLIVIEDAAEAHGAKIRGRVVGSHGHMACFSFYANKIITTGEGGMVVTNDKKLVEKLRLLRNLGFTEPRFSHEVAAYNFRMTAYQAAMGGSQLSRIGEILKSKRQMAACYREHLQGIDSIELPYEESWAEHAYWMFGIRVLPKGRVSRDGLANALRENGIDTRTFFRPMNEQPCFQKAKNFRPTSCPIGGDLWKTGILLPSSQTLTTDQVAQIAAVIRKTLAG